MIDRLVKIRVAGNTQNPAILVLESFGQRVRCKACDSGAGLVWVTGDAEEISADSPLELLGMFLLLKGELTKLEANSPIRK